MTTPAAVAPTLNVADILHHLDLGAGMTIGDFGVGGHAFFALPAARLVGEGGTVLMFDVLKSALSGALSAARMRGVSNCQAVWSNLEVYRGARGVSDGTLDAGLAINILHESKKYPDILAEIARMLKGGAKLLVVDWKPEIELGYAPPRENRLPLQHVEQVANGIGFATFEKFAAGPNHWGLVLVKT